MAGRQTKNIVFWAIIALLIIIGAFYFFWKKAPQQPEQVFCTQDAKLCPDGSYVGRTGPKCEFAACPESNFLPKGYGLKTYLIEKVLGSSCVKDGDCSTPAQYMMMSRCPFTSICLKNKCTVVCPGHE